MQSVPYIRDAIASYYGAIHGILVRVTRWNCKNIAQNVAQATFCQK
jgi:hypothetical protein